MALNGLDAAAVTAAHEAAIADPSGWFLLQYTSRDEVDLLGTGTGGFLEAREAIAKYEEESPLFGLVVFKKKKALLKYVPEGTSRLLQVRLAVHLQSVLEKFPHEALLSLTSAPELTESALSTSLTQLKSSSSVRSTASRAQRPLTEIPEDSDEPSQKVLPQTELEEISEAGKDNPIESPLDALLSPTSQPLPPAQLEPDLGAPPSKEESAPATRSRIDPPASSPTEEEAVQEEQTVSLDGRLGRPNHLARAATYEPDVSWSYKPKIKLGPRPSLDRDIHPRASGSFSRSVATLPAGIRVAAKSSPIPERPQTQHSSKSFRGEMPRYASFSPQQDRPVSRAGSVASVPAYTSLSNPSSPISPTAPGITPEKLRLMKALQQRKRYQAKKAEAEAARDIGDASILQANVTPKSSQSTVGESQKGSENEPVLLSKETEENETSETVALPAHTTITSADALVIDERAQDAANKIIETDEGLSSSGSGVSEPKSSEEAAETSPTAHLTSSLHNLIREEELAAEHDLGGESAPNVDLSEMHTRSPKEIAPNHADSDGERESEPRIHSDKKAVLMERNGKINGAPTHEHTVTKRTIEEGVYLAHSESPSSTEVGDEAQEIGSVTVSPVSVRGLPDPSKGPHLCNGELEDVLPKFTIGDHVQQEASDTTKVTSPLTNRTASDAAVVHSPSEAAELAQDGSANETETSHVVEDPETATENVYATAVPLPSKMPVEMPIAVQEPKPANHPENFHHRATESAATVKAIDAAIAGARESNHRPTDSTSTVKGPGVAPQVFDAFPNSIHDTDKESANFDSLESSPVDPKRSSAASKASNSSKRRPPPLESSKHNSSDLASIDGDLLYEELRSATVEEARPMIVSRSPATPVFQEAPHPTSRRGSENPLSRVVNSPTDVPPAEVLRPKLVQTTPPPTLLTRLDSDLALIGTKSPDGTVDFAKVRSSSSPVGRDVSVSPTNGNLSPRKGSGVSSLISQRIRAFESARSSGGASPTDRPAVITPSIVSQRKASLSTPPGSAGSAGADSLSGSRSATRRYPSQSSSPQNNFVARTFGSVRASSSHAQYHANGLHRQSSRESANNYPSTSSSRLSSVNTSPSELQKPLTSYFSVPAPNKPKDRSFSTTSAIEEPRHTGMSLTKGRRSSTTSSIPDTKRSSRASISSRRSTTSQTSDGTARPMSSSRPRSDSSFSSDGIGGEKGEKRPSRGSRLLRRMSSIALSPRRNIAHALGASLSDQAIQETKEPAQKKWMSIEIGDVNVQFPDTLLWKRRHLSIDALGNVVLKPCSMDKTSKIAAKQYYVAQFREPYVPDQDREEMPHSVILDFQDGTTLQCSCTDRTAQIHALQVLRSAYAAFSA